MTAMAIAALLAAFGAGSLIATRLEKDLATIRAGAIVWLACVVMTPVAGRIIPDYCERTGGLHATEITVLAGVILVTAICGFLSHLLIKRWIWSLLAGALATVASYAAIAVIAYVLPSTQINCPGIY